MRILREWLGVDRAPVSNPGQAEALRAIVDRLERLDPDRARWLAAFAYLLGRVAHADRDVSPAETTTMERLVEQTGHVAQEQAILIVQLAKMSNVLFGGTADYLVAREFGRIATHAEKLALLDCLFAVSAADESVELVEDNEIRRVSRELKIEHTAFIAARANYREHLKVLKKDTKPGGSEDP